MERLLIHLSLAFLFATLFAEIEGLGECGAGTCVGFNFSQSVWVGQHVAPCPECRTGQMLDLSTGTVSARLLETSQLRRHDTYSSIWVYLLEIQSGDRIIEYQNYNKVVFRLYMDGNGKLIYFNSANNGDYTKPATQGPLLQVGRWHHIAWAEGRVPSTPELMAAEVRLDNQPIFGKHLRISFFFLYFCIAMYNNTR